MTVYFTKAQSTIDIESIQTALVYDASDGRVAHFHRVVNLSGAPKRSDADIEAEAIEMAEQCEVRPENAEVLLVDEDQLDPLNEYRVDPRSRSLRVARRLPIAERVERQRREALKPRTRGG